MTDTSEFHVTAQGAGITHANRAGDKNVEMPRDLPGIVIFIHGVNDTGAVYSTVEQGLCQGINERLSRNDLRAGSYGAKYRALASRPVSEVLVKDANILNDPDVYLYFRQEVPKVTKSFFIPFYWGYRAKDVDIAKLNNTGDVQSRVADADGNLMTRGQYQDIHGNRLDAHFAKGGGFFANATNNIPDMYGEGFKADGVTQAVTRHALGGNSLYAANAPDRRYFVLAATRLANLISQIRGIKATTVAEAHGLMPEHETITVMGHSQGTIITLLAQAILKEKGQRYADCIIMVDSPYSLHQTDDCNQTGHAKLQTLVNIVNEVTQKPYAIPDLAEMLVDHEKHGGRSGQGWTPTQGKRKDKAGNWITFDERDNRGKVYLYFCPEDTVVGLKKVHGIGTFGVPDDVPADGAALRANPKPKTMPAMTVLGQPKMRFFQRMWTRMERDQHFDGQFKKVLVGTKPAHMPVRTDYERLTPGPENTPSLWGSAVEQGKNAALQANFSRRDMRFVNGEELKPPCEPELYGGEIVKGGPRPGHADVAGLMKPDDVTQDVVLGNQYAKLNWITDSHAIDPQSELEERKAAFNANKPVNEQSQNWRVGGIGGFALEREETPKEARERMAKDPDAYEANNYHSAVLHHTENHRWVTAMDVALGQAVTLDDPAWRELLILIADWKMDDAVLGKIKKNKNHDRLSDETIKLIKACNEYYQSGIFPEGPVSSTIPSLVTSELTPKVLAAQQRAQAEQREAEQRVYQDIVSRNFGSLGNIQ